MSKNDTLSPNSAPRPDELIALGNVGILFADLSGYSQLVYQCANDEARLKKLGTAVFRLFHDAACSMPNVHIEGYAGDGFLALSTGPKPAKEIYDLAQTLHQRFNADVRALLMDLGFRATVSLRTGLHVGKVWQMPLGEAASDQPGAAHRVNISDAIVVASRIITGQTCRRFGMGLSRSCYKRLLLLGHKNIREPDEVIQDRNQYPEPVEVYRLNSEERTKLNV